MSFICLFPPGYDVSRLEVYLRSVEYKPYVTSRTQVYMRACANVYTYKNIKRIREKFDKEN